MGKRKWNPDDYAAERRDQKLDLETEAWIRKASAKAIERVSILRGGISQDDFELTPPPPDAPIAATRHPRQKPDPSERRRSKALHIKHYENNMRFARKAMTE